MNALRFSYDTQSQSWIAQNQTHVFKCLPRRKAWTLSVYRNSDASSPICQHQYLFLRIAKAVANSISLRLCQQP